MTIVNILRDGATNPPLREDELIIQLFNGQLQIGCYDKSLYINGNHDYIAEPHNALALKKELLTLINIEMPELFSKRYVVHFICPQNIAAKIEWKPVEI